VLIDDVGEENIERVRGAVFFHQLANSPNAVWWDDTTTDALETREEIMLASLADTIDWFRENVGDDANEWTWGAIHTATFASNPLGISGIGPLERLVNLGPIPVDGGPGIVNATSHSLSDLAAVRAIPSMRMIVDLSDLDASQTIHSTGQSGHPTHPHYDDMLPLWQNGEYHTMLFSRELVEEQAAQTLRLRPADS
jgi:penicillin amidase